jgi:hypothetical protein
MLMAVSYWLLAIGDSYFLALFKKIVASGLAGINYQPPIASS